MLCNEDPYSHRQLFISIYHSLLTVISHFASTVYGTCIISGDEKKQTNKYLLGFDPQNCAWWHFLCTYTSLYWVKWLWYWLNGKWTENERERAIEKIFMLENKNSNYTGEIKVWKVKLYKNQQVV